jgi:hypothetical protein
MSDISRAIAAKQADIKKLQADIEALRRAASLIGEKKPTAAKPKRRRKMSAAARKAASQWMKAYWAKKKAKK